MSKEDLVRYGLPIASGAVTAALLSGCGFVEALGIVPKENPVSINSYDSSQNDLKADQKANIESIKSSCEQKYPGQEIGTVQVVGGKDDKGSFEWQICSVDGKKVLHGYKDQEGLTEFDGRTMYKKQLLGNGERSGDGTFGDGWSFGYMEKDDKWESVIEEIVLEKDDGDKFNLTFVDTGHGTKLTTIDVYDATGGKLFKVLGYELMDIDEIKAAQETLEASMATPTVTITATEEPTATSTKTTTPTIESTPTAEATSESTSTAEVVVTETTPSATATDGVEATKAAPENTLMVNSDPKSIFVEGGDFAGKYSFNPEHVIENREGVGEWVESIRSGIRSGELESDKMYFTGLKDRGDGAPELLVWYPLSNLKGMEITPLSLFGMEILQKWPTDNNHEAVEQYKDEGIVVSINMAAYGKIDLGIEYVNRFVNGQYSFKKWYIYANIVNINSCTASGRVDCKIFGNEGTEGKKDIETMFGMEGSDPNRQVDFSRVYPIDLN